MPGGILAFVIGVLLCQSLAHLPNLWILGSLLLGSAALIGTVIWRAWPRVLLLIPAVLLGLAWTGLVANRLLQHRLPAALEGHTLLLRGKICRLPQVHPQHTRLVLCDSHLISHPKLHIGRIQLNWYHHPPVLTLGERWQLAVRLKRPHGTFNPGEFQYARWLFQHHIAATGYVISRIAQDNQLIQAASGGFSMGRIRQNLQQQMQHALGSVPLAGVILALTVGTRDQISPAQWQVFRATGTSHLVAISGLHIGLVAGFLFILISFCWRCCPRLVLWIPAPRAAAIAALCAAGCYSALAGFSLPTERAFIMIMFLTVGRLWDRSFSPWLGLCYALGVIVLLNPLAPLNAGFWLSFAAVAALGYGLGGRLFPVGLWWRLGRVHWVVTLALMPLCLFFFQQAALLGLVANIVAIPWVGGVVVPLSLLGCLTISFFPALGKMLLLWAVHTLSWLWPYLHGLSQMPDAIWYHAVPQFWILGVAVIAVLCWLAPKGLPGRWVGLLGLLPLCCYPHSRIPGGTLQINLLDVGQGLSVLLRTQHHSLLYDTGPHYPQGLDSGEAIILPYFRTIGLDHLDALVISHGDNDHIGGAQTVLQQIAVGQVMTSVPQRFAAQHASGLRVIPCHQGQHWEWDGVHFQMLFPPIHYRELAKGNDRSCVLRVSTGKHSILLSGDIERPAERALLSLNHPLSADVLVAPHHGSRTSSSLAFILAVKPKVVLLPTGYRNRYRFPSGAVVARYQKAGAALFNSANTGMISLRLTPHGVTPPVSYREWAGRYWQHD